MTHDSVLSEPRLPPDLHMDVLIFSQAPSCYLLLQHLPVSFTRCQPSVPFLVGRSGGVPTLPFSPECGFLVGPESVLGAGAAVTEQGPSLAYLWMVADSLGVESPRFPLCPSCHSTAYCWVSEQPCCPFLYCGIAANPQENGLPFRTCSHDI